MKVHGHGRRAAVLAISAALLTAGCSLLSPIERIALEHMLHPNRRVPSPRILLHLERSMTPEEWQREAPGILVIAAEHGQTDAVAHLLRRGVSPDDAVRPYRQTGLMRASRGGHTEVARVLLKAGASLEKLDTKGKTALGYAYEGDRPEAARVLLEADANPNPGFAGARSLLAQAVVDQRLGWVELLGRYGGRLEPQDGALLLHEAAKGALGDDRGGAVIRTLAGLGVSLDAPLAARPPVAAKLPALHTAVAAGKVVLASALLDQGADPNGLAAGGERPLHVLARQLVPRPVYGDLTRLLLQRGADIEARADGGARPLGVAVDWGNPEVAPALLAAGADVEARDDLGRSPLFLAAAKDRLPFVEMLLAAGAALDGRGHYGATPLIAALGNSRLLVAPTLLERGADALARDERGTTTLRRLAGTEPSLSSDWEAIVERQLDLARLLLDRGVDPNAADVDGVTPLELAARRGDARFADLLLSRGAHLGPRAERALARFWESEPWREFLARRAQERALPAEVRAAFSAALRELTSADRSAQKQTLDGINRLGLCVTDWLMDIDGELPPDLTPGPAGPGSAIVPGQRVRLPSACADLPQSDGWSHPYEFRIEMADERRIANVWLRSSGRDGLFSTAPYSRGPFDPKDLDGDIVWQNVTLYRWPAWTE